MASGIQVPIGNGPRRTSSSRRLRRRLFPLDDSEQEGTWLYLADVWCLDAIIFLSRPILWLGRALTWLAWRAIQWHLGGGREEEQPDHASTESLGSATSLLPIQHLEIPLLHPQHINDDPTLFPSLRPGAATAAMDLDSLDPTEERDPKKSNDNMPHGKQKSTGDASSHLTNASAKQRQPPRPAKPQHRMAKDCERVRSLPLEHRSGDERQLSRPQSKAPHSRNHQKKRRRNSIPHEIIYHRSASDEANDNDKKKGDARLGRNDTTATRDNKGSDAGRLHDFVRRTGKKHNINQKSNHDSKKKSSPKGASEEGNKKAQARKEAEENQSSAVKSRKRKAQDQKESPAKKPQRKSTESVKHAPNANAAKEKEPDPLDREKQYTQMPTKISDLPKFYTDRFHEMGFCVWNRITLPCLIVNPLDFPPRSPLHGLWIGMVQRHLRLHRRLDRGDLHYFIYWYTDQTYSIVEPEKILPWTHRAKAPWMTLPKYLVAKLEGNPDSLNEEEARRVTAREMCLAESQRPPHRRTHPHCRKHRRPSSADRKSTVQQTKVEWVEQVNTK